MPLGAGGPPEGVCMNCYQLNTSIHHSLETLTLLCGWSHLSCSVNVQAWVAGDAFPPAEVVVVSAVYCTNPDHSIHFFGELPPL